MDVRKYTHYIQRSWACMDFHHGPTWDLGHSDIAGQEKNDNIEICQKNVDFAFKED